MSDHSTYSKSINCHWYESKALENDLYTVAIKNNLVDVLYISIKESTHYKRIKVKKALMILHENIRFFSKGHYDTEEIFNKYVTEQKRDFEAGKIDKFQNDLQTKQFKSILESVKNGVNKVVKDYEKLNNFYISDKSQVIEPKTLTRAQKSALNKLKHKQQREEEARNKPRKETRAERSERNKREFAELNKNKKQFVFFGQSQSNK